RTGLWVAIAWVLLIVSGAATTGLLRAPLTHPSVGPFVYQLHQFAGTAVGLLILGQLLWSGARRRWTGLSAVLVGVAIVMGWLCTRSAAPRTVAVHACVAAYAAVALAAAAAPSRTPGLPLTGSRPRARWRARRVQLAFALVAAQVAVGALLRHQQIELM